MDSLPLSVRLQSATSELREVEAHLNSVNLDPRILADFRDAVNRVRTTAWATQQFAESRAIHSDPRNVLSMLAGERVRAAYQLCRAISEDLGKPELRFQPGQLLELQDAVHELAQKLTEIVGKKKGRAARQKS